VTEAASPSGVVGTTTAAAAFREVAPGTRLELAGGLEVLMSRMVVVLALAAVVGAGACRTKDKYASSCKRGVELTAPWTELNLPVAEGRVCKSDESRAEMQHLTGHRPDWEQKYGEALASAGYVKGRCSDMSCTYEKGGDRATVQVIETKTWITVIVRR
jgi:hypothetical protein